MTDLISQSVTEVFVKRPWQHQIKTYSLVSVYSVKSKSKILFSFKYNFIFFLFIYFTSVNTQYYSNIFKALSEYSNIFECVLCYENEYKYLFEHQNILIFEYLNICHGTPKFADCGILVGWGGNVRFKVGFWILFRWLSCWLYG